MHTAAGEFIDAEEELPQASVTSYAAHGSRNSVFGKPVFSYSIKKEDVGKPVKYPKSANFKLLAFGKDKDLKVSTKIFAGLKDLEEGQEDEQLDINDIVRVRGRVKPVIKLDAVFYGAHGSSKSWGASLQLKVDQMVFRTVMGTKTPNYLSARRAPKVEEPPSFAPPDDSIKALRQSMSEPEETKRQPTKKKKKQTN